MSEAVHVDNFDWLMKGWYINSSIEKMPGLAEYLNTLIHQNKEIIQLLKDIHFTIDNIRLNQ